ncbi:molybdopterin-guanine dinucleotide biosynthesis protein B [Candidatus Bathyarchaeota archaeon]|nr:MAG: molybdopterin-guanine dinucleotide biosynthesis protein B [Candidatus Bathyarchaeota archaeon]
MKNLKIPMLAIFGFKKSGKTRLIEVLVKEFKRKGYRVGTLKHIHLKNFTLDQKGKDSWRHLKAGAKTVVCIAPNETSIIRKIRFADKKLENNFKFLVEDEVDCLIVEGFKEQLKDKEIPKIVTIKSLDEAQKLLNQCKNVLCVVGFKISNLQVPSFNFEEKEKIVKLVEEAWKPYMVYRKLPRIDCGMCGFKNCFEHAKAIANNKSSLQKCPILTGKITLKFQDKPIPLNRFTQNLLRNTILGMISTLKGVKPKGDEFITITINNSKHKIKK